MANLGTPMHSAISLKQLQDKISKAIEGLESEIWITADISEINIKEHAYLELTDNVEGKMIAKARALIWKRDKDNLLYKFKATSGSDLASGMKVMFKVTVSHNALHGISLTIKDVDPSYTLGQLQIKIQQIKEALNARNCFSKNKLHSIPTFFQKVAVLTPAGSAGEGDFKQDADQLQRAGICDFFYYNATMQGLQAELSMSEQLAQINNDHKTEQFDALVIIRGGGASADLSWLNNYKSALYVCNSLMPVITGLGHEKDICILDEVAAHNAGTPSKCISFITKTNFEAINKLEKNTILLNQSIASITDKANERYQKAKEYSIIKYRQLISINCERTDSKVQLMEASLKSLYRKCVTFIIDKKQLSFLSYSKLINRNEYLVIETSDSLINNINDTQNRSSVFIQKHEQRTKDAALSLPFIADTSLKNAHTRYEKGLEATLLRQSKKISAANIATLRRFNTIIQTALKDIWFFRQFEKQTINQINAADEKLVNLHKSLFLVNPQRVLERGYAIAKDMAGNTIRSEKDTTETMTIVFKDGSTTVNRVFK